MKLLSSCPTENINILCHVITTFLSLLFVSYIDLYHLLKFITGVNSEMHICAQNVRLWLCLDTKYCTTTFKQYKFTATFFSSLLIFPTMIHNYCTDVCTHPRKREKGGGHRCMHEHTHARTHTIVNACAHTHTIVNARTFSGKGEKGKEGRKLHANFLI